VSDESLRKAYKYKLRPTPEQARQLEQTLWRCRTLYNTALEERITAYRRCGVTLTCYQQQAELPDLKAAFPEYGDIHSQVLQDVLERLDTTYQAFFRRIKAGQTPGFPRSRGATAITASPTSSMATARGSTMAFWYSPRLAAWQSAGHVPMDPGKAFPRLSRSAAKSTAGMSRSRVRMCRRSPCHQRDKKRE
jgi:hypothetical protein